MRVSIGTTLIVGVLSGILTLQYERHYGEPPSPRDRIYAQCVAEGYDKVNPSTTHEVCKQNALSAEKEILADIMMEMCLEREGFSISNIYDCSNRVTEKLREVQ